MEYDKIQSLTRVQNSLLVPGSKFQLLVEEHLDTHCDAHKGQICAFFVDKDTYKFRPWVQILPCISYDSTTLMDTVTRFQHARCSIIIFLDATVETRFLALLIGLAGAGKMAMIRIYCVHSAVTNSCRCHELY